MSSVRRKLFPSNLFFPTVSVCWFRFRSVECLPTTCWWVSEQKSLELDLPNNSFGRSIIILSSIFFFVRIVNRQKLPRGLTREKLSTIQIGKSATRVNDAGIFWTLTMEQCCTVFNGLAVRRRGKNHQEPIRKKRLAARPRTGTSSSFELFWRNRSIQKYFLKKFPWTPQTRDGRRNARWEGGQSEASLDS